MKWYDGAFNLTLQAVLGLNLLNDFDPVLVSSGYSNFFLA